MSITNEFVFDLARATRGSVNKYSTAECFARVYGEERGTPESDLSLRAKLARDFQFRMNEAFGAPKHGGTYMPLSLSMRDMSSTSATALIANPLYPELVDSLIANSAVIKSGARVLAGLKEGTHYQPRTTAGASVAITFEGDTATLGSPTYDQVKVQPFTLSTSFKMSKRLMKMAYDDFLAQMLGDLQKRTFAELDRLILAGNGISEPAGLLSDPDIISYAAGPNGAAPSLANLTDMEYQLAASYAGGPLTWFTNAAVRRTARRTATAAGISPLWNANNQLLGYSTEVTANIPNSFTKGTGTNLSGTILGDFSQVVVGLWGAPAIEVTINPYANNGAAIEVTTWLECGFAFVRNEAFIACSDFIA